MLPRSKSRIVAVDLARILAAFFIMYAHIQVWDMNSNMTNIVGGFLMNNVISLDTYNCIFFVFAGYFISRRITWKKALDSALWCVIPYLLWNVVALVVAYVSLGDFPPASDGSTSVAGMVCSYLGVSGTPPVDGPLWFIRDLAVLFLVSPLIYKFSGWLFSLALVASVYTSFAGIINHDYAMMSICSLYSISFFSLGCFIGKLSPGMQQKLLSFYSIPLLCVYFGASIISSVEGLFNVPCVIPFPPCPIPFISITISVWVFYQLCRLLEEKVPYIAALTKQLAPIAFLVFAVHRIIFAWVVPLPLRGTNWMVLVPLGVFAACFVFFSY